MKSFLALSLLLTLSSCGDPARNRSLNTTATSETNKVAQKDSTATTAKCSVEVAIKKTYEQVMKLAKNNKTETMGKIFSDTSVKTFTYTKKFNADGTETPNMMTLTYWIEFKTKDYLYVAHTNLDSCTVIDVRETPAMEVSEEGAEL